VYLHPTCPEHALDKMVQINQGLLFGGSLSSGKSKCRCGFLEPQSALQLSASCSPHRRRI
jgi:hypothetical protein